MDEKEREDYVNLLKKFLDVFAWNPTDLQGIPADLGEHHIDLVDGAHSGKTVAVQVKS